MINNIQLSSHIKHLQIKKYDFKTSTNQPSQGYFYKINSLEKTDITFKGENLQKKLEIANEVLETIPDLLSSTKFILENQNELKSKKNKNFYIIKHQLDKIHTKFTNNKEKRNAALRKAYHGGNYSFKIHTEIVNTFSLKKKIGNCYESCFLAIDKLMKRGIFDFDIIHAEIYPKNNKGIFVNDHAFLIWHDGDKNYLNNLKQMKNAVVIDAWSKKVLPLPEFLTFLEKDMFIIPKKSKVMYKFHNDNITNEERDKLKNIFTQNPSQFTSKTLFQSNFDKLMDLYHKIRHHK